MALAAENALRLYKRVPIPGVQIMKSAELDGISNYKHTHLFYFLIYAIRFVKSCYRAACP